MLLLPGYIFLCCIISRHERFPENEVDVILGAGLIIGFMKTRGSTVNGAHDHGQGPFPVFFINFGCDVHPDG
jgi:hypothetical protein